MNKTIKMISLLLGLVVFSNASAMKLAFTLSSKKDVQSGTMKHTYSLAKRERDPQDVVAQPASPKKQNAYTGTEERYFAIRTPIDPVWINCIYKAFYEAVERGNLANVQELLGFGLNLNELIGPVKMTLLHRAALRGNVEVAKLLLANGAQLNVPMASGKTALHIAAECGHLAMVKLLVESGADITTRTIATGETPKALAIANLHVGVAAYFNALEAYLAKEASFVEKQHMIPVDSRESILTSSGCTEIAMDFDDAAVVQQLRSIRDVEMDEDMAVVALVSLQRQ